MSDFEPLGDHPVPAVDHVVIAVVREATLESVGRLARTAATECVGDNDEVSSGIQRLSVSKQFVGQSWSQPIGARTRIALQQQYAVDDFTGGIALRRAKDAVVQFQLRERLAAGEFVVRDDEIALLVVGPVDVFGFGESGCGDAQEGNCNDSAKQHD